MIDPLMNENYELFTDTLDIEKCLFSVFFEAKHLLTGNFDDVFYREVNNLYEIIIEEDTAEETVTDETEDIYNLNRNVYHWLSY